VIESRDSEKIPHRDIPGVNQPSVTVGPQQNGQEIPRDTQTNPERIDPREEVEEVLQGDLRKEEKNDGDRHEKGEQEAFQRRDSMTILKRNMSYFSEKRKGEGTSGFRGIRREGS
jgi:hypothetical protein